MAPISFYLKSFRIYELSFLAVCPWIMQWEYQISPRLGVDVGAYIYNSFMVRNSSIKLGVPILDRNEWNEQLIRRKTHTTITSILDWK